ncbi:hypothetical protein VTI74DRAFT_4927 [Chaetomium olivicolor]
MTVSNNLYHPTEDLISAKPRRRFRTGVRWQHWQLRSLIGTDVQNKQHCVYFPVPGPDNRSSFVQRLDTKSQEIATVKRLSFSPRCLVARNGWVCCGGELGIFSAFRVGEPSRPHDASREADSQAGTRLPTDAVGTPSTTTATTSPPAEKDLLARSNAFGKDRVNCVTLWFPPTLFDAVEGAYDQDVAVLANNDSSVIVVSLRDQELLDKITYPDYMNRGVISPDGRLLIAISDDPYLYIHERKEKEKKPEGGLPFHTADRPTYEWSACGKIQLKSQRKDDRSDNRGSFAACFSSTGRYLAVGTQYGTISIFDATLLGVPGADPLLTSFNTSRSNAEFGAVRDMAFSPGPIDLLAWTEDRGRVGIADLRTGFDSRQILHLDNEDGFEHLEVTEANIIDRCTIDPRLLDQRGERGETLLSGLLSALEPSLESRLNRPSEGQSPFSRYNVPLTPEETAVLEAIQDYRRRHDPYASSSARTGAESANNSNGSNGGGVVASGRPIWAERAARIAESRGAREQRASASLSRTANEIFQSAREQRDRLRAQDETSSNSTTNNSSTADRRRYAANNPFSAAPSATLGWTATGTGRGTLISRLLASATNPTSSGPPAGDDVELLAAYFMRDWEEPPSRRGIGLASHSRPGPYDTAGLSWSEDGESLFVGAENGIFEFHVNLFGRKCSPSITLS